MTEPNCSSSNTISHSMIALAVEAFAKQAQSVNGGDGISASYLDRMALNKGNARQVTIEHVRLLGTCNSKAVLCAAKSSDAILREELLRSTSGKSLQLEDDFEELFLEKHIISPSQSIKENIVFIEEYDIYVYRSAVLTETLNNCIFSSVSGIDAAEKKTTVPNQLAVDIVTEKTYMNDAEVKTKGNEEIVKKAKISPNLDLEKPVKPERVIQFLRCAGMLKKEKRTGWVLRNVPDPESVSDHSWRVALCSYLITDKNVNPIKASQLGILHDLAEAIVGDLAPSSGVSGKEKENLEHDAMVEMTDSILGAHPMALKIRALWQEYENRKSKESTLVKDFDLFEMVLQADEYEIQHPEINLEEFFQGVDGRIKHPEVQAWYAELIRQRNERKMNCRDI